MSPEQARGDREIDQRSDIYSLGVILYELLCARRPHDGDGYNAILFRILTCVPEPLARLREGLPAGLAEVVACAMAFDARNRYAGARDLAAALAPFASPARARTAALPRPAPSAPAATMPAPDSGQHVAGNRLRASAASRGPSRLRRARTATVAVAVTAAAAVAAVALFSPSRAADDRRRAPPAALTEASRPKPSSSSSSSRALSPSPPPPVIAASRAPAAPPAVVPRSAVARRPPVAPQPTVALARPTRSLSAGHAASPAAPASAAPARASTPSSPMRSRSTVPSSAAALEFDSRNPYDD
jgi:serine/threonine-protein kinase